MKYILLPGFSEANKEWAESLKNELLRKGIDLIIVHWNHWKNGDTSLDFPAESQKIMKLISDDEVTLLAKSVGTLLASTLIQNFNLKPKKLILMGIPGENDLYNALTKIDPKIITVIQNQDDPHMSFIDMEKMIKSISPEIKLVKTNRSDHSYPFPEQIFEELK